MKLTVACAGLDAIARVLKKAKQSGGKDIGHGYKKSLDLGSGTGTDLGTGMAV
jgi:hypothetical protein